MLLAAANFGSLFSSVYNILNYICLIYIPICHPLVYFPPFILILLFLHIFKAKLINRNMILFAEFCILNENVLIIN